MCTDTLHRSTLLISLHTLVGKAPVVTQLFVLYKTELVSVFLHMKSSSGAMCFEWARI